MFFFYRTTSKDLFFWAICTFLAICISFVNLITVLSVSLILAFYHVFCKVHRCLMPYISLCYYQLSLLLLLFPKTFVQVTKQCRSLQLNKWTVLLCEFIDHLNRGITRHIFHWGQSHFSWYFFPAWNVFSR